jgi:DNA-binding response OmpR family regulator
MPVHRILSVGQCAFDHRNLASRLGARLDAEITPADTFDEALTELRAGAFDLLLVNRVTDADNSSGLELIRSVKADPSLASIPTMLVSDFPEAQAKAVALGAFPGFGKSAMAHQKTLSQIEAVLTRSDQ